MIITSITTPGNLAPDRPLPSCGACNCMPGFCMERERLRQREIEAVVQANLNTPLEIKIAPFLRKNRKQRRIEASLARRGPPAKKRK